MVQRGPIGEKQHVSVSLVCVNHGEVVFLWVSTMRIFGPNHLFFAQFVGLLQYIIFFQFLNYFIVMQLLLSAFSRHLSTPLQPNPPPSPASTLPLGFVHVSFIVVPENPSPHCHFSPAFWLSLDFS